jgi:hypothetical protein
MKVIIGGREFEVSDEVITKAIEDKTNVTIEPDLVIRDKTEDEVYATNLRAEAKKAGVEVAVKEMRTSLGLSFEGKTMDNLIDAVKVKTLADANIEPAEQLKSAMKDIDTLKGTISTLTTEKETIGKQFHSFKTDAIVNNTIASLLPENIAVPKDDMILLMKNKMKFEVDETNKVIVKNASGEVMKNATTLEPLQPKDVITTFFNNNPSYVKGAKGGNGGDDETNDTTKMTVEAFMEKKAKEGIGHTDPKFIAELTQLKKDGGLAD